MDAGLSLIMANMANVKNNSLVFDPFVGTGNETLYNHYNSVSLFSCGKAFIIDNTPVYQSW